MAQFFQVLLAQLKGPTFYIWFACLAITWLVFDFFAPPVTGRLISGAALFYAAVILAIRGIALRLTSSRDSKNAALGLLRRDADQGPEKDQK